MGVLDGKAAIVTGSARGIGRATAELLAEQGARVLINDLDADVAEQAASEIQRRDRRLRRRPDQAGRARRARQEGRGRVRPDRHRRQQRRLHPATAPAHKMTDDAVPGDARHPHVVPFRVLRAAAPHLREPAKKEREEGREVFRKIVNVTSISGTMGNAGQANYSAGQGGRRRPDQDAGQGVGPVQDQRERRGVRLRGDAPHRRQGGRAARSTKDGEEIAARHPRADARDGGDDHPARAARQPRGGRRPVFFLCSPWSNYVHGQVLNVTGGQFGGMYT